MQVLTPLKGCFILTIKYFEVHFFNFRMILHIAKMTQILFQSSLDDDHLSMATYSLGVKYLLKIS